MDDRRTVLAGRLRRTRRRTLDLFAPLPAERLGLSPSAILSPPLWDLGHIAAYEELWLCRNVGGRSPLHPALQDVYDAFETPRRRRADAAILGEAEAYEYLRVVREASLEVLATAPLDGDDRLTADGAVFDMVAQHEAQHTETVLQAFQLMPAGAYVPPARRPAPGPGDTAGPDWVAIPGGPFEMGAPAGGFAYDCERPRHTRETPPVLMARDPVTNGAHLAFIADGGYQHPGLWTAEGWEWRVAEDVRAPLYWEPDGAGGWLTRSFERVGAVDPVLPLCHVSAHEADAHARWAGARLPTEAEWERAAAGAEPSATGANLGQERFGTDPVGARPPSPSGCRGMLGDVWEWTSDTLEGYPGFRPFPYREYAEVFFGQGHRVLRGGSWATQEIAARATFRNWDLPRRRQIFAGLRLARDVA